MSQICGDVSSQLRLVPDLHSRLSAVRRQLLCSPGTLHRSDQHLRRRLTARLTVSVELQFEAENVPKVHCDTL